MRKNTENNLVDKNKNNRPSEDEVQQNSQNYIETERSEEVWKEIMKSYHMGEGVQGIFNGCSNIIDCRKKLKELQRLLIALLERDDGHKTTIDKKIAMVEETIAQYEILLEDIQQQRNLLRSNDTHEIQGHISQKKGRKNNS